MKIAWKPLHYNFNVASSRLRSFLPCKILKSAGWDCEIYNPKHQNNYQLVIFQKAYDPPDLILAEKLKNQGTKIILDLCDNHFYNPYQIPEFVAKEKRLRKMIELANLVTVATPALGKLIHGKANLVIDDVVDPFPETLQGKIRSKIASWKNNQQYRFNVLQKSFSDAISPSPLPFTPTSARSSFKVVWFGSSQLAKIYSQSGIKDAPAGLDSIKKVLPALEKINQEIPVQLTIISNSQKRFRQATKNTNFSCIYYEWNLATFPFLMQQQDVCIIPIEFNNFSICKTSNRLITALNQGVAVVADKIPSYEEFGEFVLFADWENGLGSYADNPALRAQHVHRGKEYIIGKYTQDRVVEQWSNAFKQVLAG